MGMLIDRMRQDIRDNMLESQILSELMNPLRALKSKAEAGQTVQELAALAGKQAQGRQKAMESLQKAGALSARDKRLHKAIAGFLLTCEKCLRLSETEEGGIGFLHVKEQFDARVADYKQDTERVKDRMHFLFQFVEDTFGSGNEMLILVTECTVQADCARFIGLYGCEDYQRHNEELMLTERGTELTARIEELEL